METLSTITKKLTVWGCSGREFHLVPGTALLNVGKGYECPYCGAEVADYSDTPVGKSYLEIARHNLFSPALLRTLVHRKSVL
jgi:hypothetical protein